MRMYRVGDAHHVTQDDAKRSAKALGVEWTTVEVPVKIRELADYMNGLVADVERAVPAPPPAPKADPLPVPTFAAQSLEIDDLWDTLPLARKFHFAAMAMEEARDLVPSRGTASAADLL